MPKPKAGAAGSRMSGLLPLERHRQSSNNPSLPLFVSPRLLEELAELEGQFANQELLDSSIQPISFSDLTLESVLSHGNTRSLYAVQWQPESRESGRELDQSSSDCGETTSSDHLPQHIPKDDQSIQRQDSHRSQLSALSVSERTHSPPSCCVPRKTYALKALNPSRLQALLADHQIAAVSHMVQDLYLEAQLLSQSHHQHIVSLRGVSSEGLVESFRNTTACPPRSFYGFFFLMDPIHENLQTRLPRWKHYQQPRLFQLGKGHRPPFSSSQKDGHHLAAATTTATRTLLPSSSSSSSASDTSIHRARFETKGDLPERLEVARGVAEALLYLHTKRIVVRDLSPSTIGFDAHTGVVKLFDLQKARPVEESFLDAELVGSFRYMAPENLLCQPSGLPSDIYSFGIVFWEILTLHQPFNDFFTMDRKTKQEIFCQSKFTDQVILNKQWRPSCSGIPDLEAKRLIQECWCSSPEARPSAALVVWRLQNTIGIPKPSGSSLFQRRAPTLGSGETRPARRSSKRLSFASTDTAGSSSSFQKQPPHPKGLLAPTNDSNKTYPNSNPNTVNPGETSCEITNAPRKKGFLSAFLPRGSFSTSSSR